MKTLTLFLTLIISFTCINTAAAQTPDGIYVFRFSQGADELASGPPSGPSYVLNVNTTGQSDLYTNQPYSQTLNVSGGVAPYTWTLVGNPLPHGLSFSPSGTISGTPTSVALGSWYNLIFQVEDSNGVTADLPAFTYHVIDPLSFPPVYQEVHPGENVSFYLAPAGGRAPFTYQIISGSLPNGLQRIQDNISGTVTHSGDFSATVQVTDFHGETAQGTVHLPSVVPLVSTQPLTITTSVGDVVMTPSYWSGGTFPYHFELVAGDTLPAGLSLDPASGYIMGDPTAATAPGGHSFRVVVSDSGPVIQAITVNGLITVHE